MTEYANTAFDKVFAFTTRPKTERGWLGRDIHTASVTVGVVWQCKQCKEYFTTDEAKKHRHAKD